MKDFDKLVKALGEDTQAELDKLDANGLARTIVESSSAMQQVRDELEANALYQELKEKLNAATAGKREVDKRQKAKIKYCLMRLQELGVEAAQVA
jgi:uncharacterized coiled-coil protein SlyX